MDKFIFKLQIQMILLIFFLTFFFPNFKYHQIFIITYKTKMHSSDLQYFSTLATSTLIILFSEMLTFHPKTIFFFRNNFLVENFKNQLKYLGKYI
jgi:hypothetical protein